MTKGHAHIDWYSFPCGKAMTPAGVAEQVVSEIMFSSRSVYREQGSKKPCPLYYFFVVVWGFRVVVGGWGSFLTY